MMFELSLIRVRIWDVMWAKMRILPACAMFKELEMQKDGMAYLGLCASYLSFKIFINDRS